MLRELQSADPQFIGPYQVRGLLGAGGMGRVYLGLSAGGQFVAVKVIRPDLAADPEFRARFQREIAVAQKVSSQFTAPVVDADLDGPAPWLATAYVDGPSLDRAVAEHGPLPVHAVLRLAAGLAEGLSAIHAAGVVHRDLKPSNVLLAGDGPRVIDFGISRATEATALTRTGLVVGSPGFMSPEQAEGRQVGPPSDVFSLGAVLAFAASGEGPFGSGSTPALVYRVVFQPPSLDRVPAEVRLLAGRCLAKDPGARPTARDLLATMNAPGGAEAVPAAAGPPLATSPLAESVTRTITQPPAPAGASRTAAFAGPPRASWPAPGQDQRRQDRRHPRRLTRSLAIASIATGVLAASAAGAFALTGSGHQGTGAHSGHVMPARASSAASAPRRSAATNTSPSVAASMAGDASTTPSTPAAATPSAAATPAGSTSPAVSTSPAAGPTATSAGNPSPAPSGTMGPASAPSATPTPASS